MNWIYPGSAVKVDDIVEFFVAVFVHPVEKIMAVVPTRINMHPIHLFNAIADRLDEVLALRNSGHTILLLFE